MSNTVKRMQVHVLSMNDTQRWHSPFSKELRRWRRSKILKKCIRDSRESGFAEYALYDANETYLAGGKIRP